MSLDVSVDNSEGAAARVRNGDEALGFIEGALDDPLLDLTTVAEDRLVLVSAAPTGKVDAGWLRAAPWIVLERGWDALKRRGGVRGPRRRSLNADDRHNVAVERSGADRGRSRRGRRSA